MTRRRVLLGAAIVLLATAGGLVLRPRAPLPEGLTGALVFVSDREGTPALYWRRLPRDRERRLTFGSEAVGEPSVSPDGTRVAFSMNGQNAHFGSPVNGAAPERITGGSSCGSAAAVSHALCDFALGTDTGGSVRAPASHCGLVGLRPTHGRVSLADALDLSPSLDTCGFFARDARTFARVADVLLGADASPLPACVRLLRPVDVWKLLAREVAEALTPALARVKSNSVIFLPLTNRMLRSRMFSNSRTLPGQ